MFQRLCFSIVMTSWLCFFALAVYGQDGFKFKTTDTDAPAKFSWAITDYDAVAAPIPPLDISVDNRPVLEMLTANGDWCKYCNWWKERGDKDLPFRIVPVVVIDTPRFGFPTFRIPHGKDGREWFIANPGPGSDASVNALVAAWRRRAADDGVPQATGDAAAAGTPYAEIVSVFEAELKPGMVVVDPGCGDARALIVAVDQFHAKQGIGVEIDPVRADAARARVRSAGLSNKIEIITGDSTKMSLKGDVLFAYLYPETMSALNLDNFDKVISYMHPVPGRTGTKRNQFYVYTKSQPPKAQIARTAMQYEWRQVYVPPYQVPGRECGNGSCAMCYGGYQWKQVPVEVNIQNQALCGQFGCSGHGCTGSGCAGRGCAGCSRNR